MARLDGSHLVVRPSFIRGRGVFTERNFRAGDVVFSTREYSVTSQPMYGSLQRKSGEHLIEPNVLRWTNHSCHPNCVMKFADNRIELVAIRDINFGEELTCDYRVTEDSIPIPFQCACEFCKRIIIR